MNTLKLADGTCIMIEEGTGPDGMRHMASSEDDALAVCEALTPQALKRVEIFSDGEEDPHGIYDDLALIEPPIRQSIEGGKVLVTIRLREKTDLELRVDALEESQATQDGAIEDLGLAVSDVVEG